MCGHYEALRNGVKRANEAHVETYIPGVIVDAQPAHREPTLSRVTGACHGLTRLTCLPNAGRIQPLERHYPAALDGEVAVPCTCNPL